MLEFLGFRRSKDAKLDSLTSKAMAETAGAQSKNNLRREMVRLALSSALGHHGIAAHWLGCEVFPMPRPPAADAVFVHLVILKWHEGLMRFAPDIEAEVLREIQLFDKTSVPADFVFSWKFAAGCGHPGGKLPAPDYWTLAPEAKAADTLVNPAQIVGDPNAPPAVAKFDLPKSELDFDDTNRDFAITQIEEFK